jgi:hypothetical protein
LGEEQFLKENLFLKGIYSKENFLHLERLFFVRIFFENSFLKELLIKRI